VECIVSGHNRSCWVAGCAGEAAARRPSGAAKPGHSTADYRKAFSRIYRILHACSCATISKKLQALGMPGMAHDLASNPFPRLRIAWNPLAGGSPHIAGNERGIGAR
jgi:hypothetical protein